MSSSSFKPRCDHKAFLLGCANRQVQVHDFPEADLSTVAGLTGMV